MIKIICGSAFAGIMGQLSFDKMAVRSTPDDGTGIKQKRIRDIEASEKQYFEAFKEFNAIKDPTMLDFERIIKNITSDQGDYD